MLNGGRGSLVGAWRILVGDSCVFLDVDFVFSAKLYQLRINIDSVFINFKLLFAIQART